MYRAFQQSIKEEKIQTPRKNFIPIQSISSLNELQATKQFKRNFEEEVNRLKDTINELLTQQIKYEEDIFNLNNQIQDYEDKLNNTNDIMDKNFELMKLEEDKLSQLRKENIQLKKKKVTNKEDEIDKVIENSENILKGISKKPSRQISKKPLAKQLKLKL